MGRGAVLLTVLAAALGVVGAACHGHAGTDSGMQDGSTSTMHDVSFPDSTGGRFDANRIANHFDACGTESECPIGDSCTVPPQTPPIDDPTAPTECRPQCATDNDCAMPGSMAGYGLSCDTVDHHCQVLCGTGLPGCNPGYTCQLFHASTMGYCIH
jgi:hypothetical protein